MLTGDYGIPWATGEGSGKSLVPVVDCWHHGTRRKKAEFLFLCLFLTRTRQALLQMLERHKSWKQRSKVKPGLPSTTCVSLSRWLAFSVLLFATQRILSSMLVSFDCELDTGLDYLRKKFQLKIFPGHIDTWTYLWGVVLVVKWYRRVLDHCGPHLSGCSWAVDES